MLHWVSWRLPVAVTVSIHLFYIQFSFILLFVWFIFSPNIILSYNMTKGGVDKSDQMEAIFSVTKVSQRPYLINLKVILKLNKNISSNNSDLLRRIFLKNLVFQLMDNWFRYVFLEKWKPEEFPKKKCQSQMSKKKSQMFCL